MKRSRSGFFAVSVHDGETALYKDGKGVARYSQPAGLRPRRMRLPVVSAADRFVGAKLKIERAKRHIADFETSAKRFSEEDPYELIANVDAKTGENVFRMLIKKQIPHHFSALLGDAIHNLRSALDYLITDMIQAARGEIKYNERFPIPERRKALKPGGVPEIRSVGRAANRLIRLLNGDQCTSAGLWTLHWLDIIDKHHAIVPVAAATIQITAMVGAPGMFIARSGELCIGGGPPGSRPYLVPAGTPAHFKRTFLLGDDVEVHRSPGGFQEQVNVIIAISFGQTKVAQREPVIETLRQLTEFTERTLEIFERHLQAPRK